ncbi:class I SAM-dependent methyltransferase [Phenylobacterium sp.]|uniref:class I SAM-dependent methyltransferase n=1 Tax=Phenylobacterium sp. TaxID=1871053 RepID=UPI0025D1AFB8|nr:class I SAM-dependent methyltransferase [Phenylobacterium sp.]MBX3481946.1 class I SAM-dependent methyltransferase [Phenylobacterium sp.]
MAKVAPYYAAGSLSAAFYDRVTAADPTLVGDEQVYAGLAPPEGAILELGAGTGRLTAALAARGHDVTGVDISPAMLAQGRARIEALAPGVRARAQLVRGDMTALDLKRAFDLVICPFFTLAHVPGGAAWRNTFATAARHLGPGGLAAFHLPKPDIMRLPGPADPSRPVMELALEDGRRLLLFVRERRFREGVGRLDQVIEYAVADAAGRIVRKSAERLTYWWTDPEPPAAAAGLVRDRDPIELGGVGAIQVFRKT